MVKDKWFYWVYIGIRNIHGTIVVGCDGIDNTDILGEVADMHNEGALLEDIDRFLLDAPCTQDEREIIVERIGHYITKGKDKEPGLEYRAIMRDTEEALQLDKVNVDVLHDIEYIGLFRGDELITKIPHIEIKRWNSLFMGQRYKR